MHNNNIPQTPKLTWRQIGVVFFCVLVPYLFISSYFSVTTPSSLFTSIIVTGLTLFISPFLQGRMGTHTFNGFNSLPLLLIMWFFVAWMGVFFINLKSVSHKKNKFSFEWILSSFLQAILGFALFFLCYMILLVLVGLFLPVG